MQQFKLVAMTAPLTLFIWVSADQLLTETAQIPADIVIQAEPGSMMVIMSAPGGSKNYSVTISGRQKDVAALRDSGTLAVALTLKDEIIGDHELGPFVVVLRDELIANPTIFEGCIVQAVTPATMAVTLDRRVVKPIPVRVRSAGIDFAVEPRVEPEIVNVTLRQSLLNELESANPRIMLDGDSLLKNQPAGEPVRLQVPVQPTLETDRGNHVVFAVHPDTVALRATLRQKLARGTIQTVPIRFLVSPIVHGRYNVEFRQENPIETLRVDVLGPPQVVDELVSGQTKTFAVVTLGTPDPFAEGAYQFYKPEFDLPTGVTLAPDAEIPSFEIRLVPRIPTATQPAATP